MFFQKFLSKRAYLRYALFFLLVSCQKAPQWEISKTITFNAPFNSGRLFYNNEAIGGLELELDYGISGLRMYVNVFSLEVPSLFENTNIAQIRVESNDEFYIFMGTILTGGQRILLSEEACDKIIDHLLAGFDLSISIGRYRAIIPSCNFPGLYQALLRIPI